MLRKAYRETILLQPNNSKYNDWWFKYTAIVFTFKDVALEDNYTLARYGIRPGDPLQLLAYFNKDCKHSDQFTGSEILAECIPKVNIFIKNHAGQRKTYKFEGTADMTIQMVKEKYLRVRNQIGAHDWTSDDIVLLDRNYQLIDDKGNLIDYAPGLRFNRGGEFYKKFYKKFYKFYKFYNKIFLNSLMFTLLSCRY